MEKYITGILILIIYFFPFLFFSFALLLVYQEVRHGYRCVLGVLTQVEKTQICITGKAVVLPSATATSTRKRGELKINGLFTHTLGTLIALFPKQETDNQNVSSKVSR